MNSIVSDMSARTRDILRLIIDSYLETGEPVGSAAVAQRLGMRLSPATIRHVMVDLEELGLLYSPHTSAGRLPTDKGLSVFVDGLLEMSHAPEADDRQTIERGIDGVKGRPLPDILEQTSGFLSGLSSCAGLVFAPKSESRIRQIDFVLLAPGRALAVLVNADGAVENRVLEVADGVTATELQRAAHYLNARIADKTLAQAVQQVENELRRDRTQLDALSARVAQDGIARFAPEEAGGHLFISGQAHLLDDVTAIEDLERIRALFDALEEKRTLLQLLQATAQADGVRIFIGADNPLFRHSGCAMIVAPYKNPDAQIVGAVGVIGPARLNYGRVISVVNYTSQMIGRVIG